MKFVVFLALAIVGLAAIAVFATESENGTESKSDYWLLLLTGPCHLHGGPSLSAPANTACHESRDGCMQSR
jgi:hypothetical protein